MSEPSDASGAPLRRGDAVRAIHLAETGIVMRADGALVCIRIDSSGQYLSSVAGLWRKL